MKEFIYRNGGATPTGVASRIGYKYHGVDWLTNPAAPVEVQVYNVGGTTEKTHGFYLNGEPTRAFKVVASVNFNCFGFDTNSDVDGRYLIPYSESYDSTTGYYTKIYEAYTQYQPYCDFDSWLFEITKRTYTTDSNNRRLMDNIADNEIISIETYQGWLGHDISEYGWSRYAPIATTANIGITGKTDYAGGVWTTSYYTDNTQSTPMYYIEKTNEDRVIQMITYGSVGLYEALICDTTGGDNISNITKPTYTQVSKPMRGSSTNYTFWEIQVPANKRLLLLTVTGTTPGTYTSYVYYKGYNNPEVGLRVIPWENTKLHSYGDIETETWEEKTTSSINGYYTSLPNPNNTPPSSWGYSSSQTARYKCVYFQAKANTTYKIIYTLPQAGKTLYFGGTVDQTTQIARVGYTGNFSQNGAIYFMNDVQTTYIDSTHVETIFTTPSNWATGYVFIDNQAYSYGQPVSPVFYEKITTTTKGWTND